MQKILLDDLLIYSLKKKKKKKMKKKTSVQTSFSPLEQGTDFHTLKRFPWLFVVLIIRSANDSIQSWNIYVHTKNLMTNGLRRRNLNRAPDNELWETVTLNCTRGLCYAWFCKQIFWKFWAERRKRGGKNLFHNFT